MAGAWKKCIKHYISVNSEVDYKISRL